MLFSLIKNELWHYAISFFSLSQLDYSELLSDAEGQTVQGLVCDALIKNNVKLKEENACETISYLTCIQYQNHEVNKELVEFVKGLENEGIDYVLVKGQTLAAHYPNPMVRMPGDVDIYLTGENFNRALAFVEKITGEKLIKYSDGKHVEFMRNDVFFELHDILSQFSTRSHQRYFDQLIEDVIRESNTTVVIDGYNVKTLPPTYNILYTFIHLFYHLTAQGIGLRQFCDLAVLIGTAPVEEVNTGDLEERLKALGLLNAFRAVGSVLVNYLGLKEDRFPFVLSGRDKLWGKKILNNVMKRGNFGRNIRTFNTPGFVHSIESGWLVVKQAFIFFRLAPTEVLGRFFSIGNWFLKRHFPIS